MGSFGIRLKQEREQRGITLEEISSTTKIGTRMLLALEQDHFDQLPGGIFNKGFIRAYARCLGLDEDQTITDYLAATGSLPPDKDKEKDKDKKFDGAGESSFEFQAQTGRGSNLPWGTFVVLLLIVALGFAAWGFYSREARRSARKTTPTPAAAPNPFPATAAVPVTSPAAQPPAPVSSPAAALRPFTLRVMLRAGSWLSITADGHEVLQGTSFGALTEKTVHATKEIVVKAGNSGAIEFEFNGKRLPPQGALGEVKTLTFDATGLRSSTPMPVTPAQP